MPSETKPKVVIEVHGSANKWYCRVYVFGEWFTSELGEPLATRRLAMKAAERVADKAKAAGYGVTCHD